jgi:hypothetical protein
MIAGVLGWPEAFVILGTILGGIAGLIRIYGMKNPEIEKLRRSLLDLQTEVHRKLDLLVSKIDTADYKCDHLEIEFKENIRIVQEVHNKIDEKIEKMGDLVIEIIKAQNNQSS